ncbi:MAG: hypothetical protein RL654_654 [Pseudomonadota bacterium]|jgi:hypothetical protein
MTDRAADDLMNRLHAALGREFSEIRFWGFAVVRPSDRNWRLESVEREGATLLLGLRDLAGPPLLVLLALDRPTGLTVSAHGLTFERSARLGFDGHEAWPEADGRHYGLATPRGTGRFEIQGLPALTLQV